MFDRFYIHDIIIERITGTTRDTSTYPVKTVNQVAMIPKKAFLDTPSTTDVDKYHQRNIKLTRFMYYDAEAFNIKKTDVIIYKNERYEVTGDDEDQGGQGKYMRLPLNKL
ncbi:hypothetical protein MKY53_05180 [Macrococcus sp. FSL R5-0951]